MKNLPTSASWNKLVDHYLQISRISMRDLFAEDHHRFNEFSTESCDILLDYSKNIITSETIELLSQLADAANIKKRIEQLFTGQLVNSTENRAALHTALRSLNQEYLMVQGENIMPLVNQTLNKMTHFSQQLHVGNYRGFSDKPFTDIVNIGIGGSDLGPAMVTEALSPYKISTLRIHFVSNIDGSHINDVLKSIDPETTLFLISSKSFTTLETLTNANTAKKWFLQSTNQPDAIKQHFIAITKNTEQAKAFGITSESIFEIGDWVGGRYSLWSGIGLPIALSIGMDNFKELLLGAHTMDQHFCTAPFSQNLPMILALLGIWYRNFFDFPTHAIFPYDQYLRRLPAYLQQADMESNGKSIQHTGDPVTYPTGPIIWGEVGCNGQHAFHQLLHQGTHIIPVDFIIPIRNHHNIDHHHTLLFANCLSQSQALMLGKTKEEAYEELIALGYSTQDAKKLAPHKATPGNRPSNTMSFPKLTPRILGSLIALYEHKIFVQGCIWNINSFDQWGVELGKQLAGKILPDLDEASLHLPTENPSHDASTNGLIRYYKKTLRENVTP
jgi:glucose-6-phosphate isomerase